MKEDLKKKNYREKIAPWFRKTCYFKDKMAGNINIYAFDTEADDKGVRWIMENCFFGSRKLFEQEIGDQLGIAPEEAIMFGAGVHPDFSTADKPLDAVVKKDEAGIWGAVFYNPISGAVYLCDEGSFEELPLNLSRLNIYPKSSKG